MRLFVVGEPAKKTLKRKTPYPLNPDGFTGFPAKNAA